jgi:hypothetical protein
MTLLGKRNDLDFKEEVNNKTPNKNNLHEEIQPQVNLEWFNKTQPKGDLIPSVFKDNFSEGI